MSSLKRFACAFLCLTIAACSAPATGNNLSSSASSGSSVSSKSSGLSITQYTLPNGLKVVLQPIHSVPVVALSTWVHVGSKDEDDITRGLAHIQEHMLFQGTDKYKTGEIFQTVEGVGGDMNAYTDYDETVYHITMPSSSLKTGLDILSSMMSTATIDPVDLKKELEVIMEEFRRDKDDATREVDADLFKTAFTVHPYHHPIIGYQPTIEKITAPQVKDFYTKWYVPQNMTFVLVGDFDETAIKNMITQTFGDIPTRTNPKHDIAPEPEQTQTRAVVKSGSFTNTKLELGFKNTGIADTDTPTLDTLYAILGGSESSRLVQQLREKQKLVSAIESYSQTPEQAGLGIITADIDAKYAKAAMAGILTEVAKLRTTPVTTQELERAKLKITSDFIYKREDFSGMADMLGYFAVLAGSPDKQQAYLDDVRALTPADIQNAAQKYLVTNHLTIALLYPQTEKNQLKATDLVALANQPITSSASGATLSSSVTVSSAQTSSVIAAAIGSVIISRVTDDALHVTKVQFANGLTLLVREDHSVPTIAFDARFHGGTVSEPQSQAGISALLSQLFIRSTAHHTQEQIASLLENTASHIDPVSDEDTIGLTGQSLSEYSKPTLALLGELITTSTYPDDQITQVKSLMTDSLKQQKDKPSSLAYTQLKKGLYGDHPYGRNTLGSADTLADINHEKVAAFASQILAPQNLTLTIVGDIDPTTAIDQIATLAAWPKSSTFTLPTVAAPQPLTSSKVLYTASATEQTNIFYGFPGIVFGNPDRFAIAVMNKILSGASGRLFATLRNKEALAYSVQGIEKTYFSAPGFYALYIGCQPDKTAKAIAGLKRELTDLTVNGVHDDAELKRATDYIAGDYAIGLQSFSAQSSNMNRYELSGFGYKTLFDYLKGIQAVTKADVQRVAKTYLAPEKSVLSVVGPLSVK